MNEKEVQISLTVLMDKIKNTRNFMEELWPLLISAHIRMSSVFINSCWMLKEKRLGGNTFDYVTYNEKHLKQPSATLPSNFKYDFSPLPSIVRYMEISMLKILLNGISSFLQLSSLDTIQSEPLLKYYQKTEEIFKLLKTVLDVIVDSEIASNEVFIKEFEELGLSIDELRELFDNWQPLSSKVDFVFQTESLISKVRTSGLDILQLLKSSDIDLPDELSSSSLETSSIIREAARDQVEGVGPSSDILIKIAGSLSLRSNQEILIEAVALEKLKENAEQAEKAGEAEFIEQIIALITRMHERLAVIKQSQTNSPVPIPADFCCPLSLELMTDPVIVASGQTYERAFIKQWINLGLTVCPKTRQPLAHTNHLIPNYTVKALIANWCESNNVKLPDPMKSLSLNQPCSLLRHAEPGKESYNIQNSRGNQSPLTESSRARSSSSKNLTSTSPLRSRSASDGSPSRNGIPSDMARLSLTGSEDRFTHSEERDIDSVGHNATSSSGKENSNGEDDSSQGHNRSGSNSRELSNGNLNQGVENSDDTAEETAQLAAAYNSDNSGEVKPDPRNSPLATRREPDFLPRLETRSRTQPIWRRPSDRFVPRIVSSPTTESRPDLSGIETQVKKLIEDLKSDSIETQREATAQIRVLARTDNDNRIVIATCGAIKILVELLTSSDSKIQENAVTALLNLSINDNNKTAIADANAIEPLIHVLESGSPEAKENSAATLFSLSVLEDNKIRIGRSGAIRPLVDLLGNGTPRGKKDAATALFNLSIFHENKARIVQAGAVRHLVELMEPAAGMVDKAVAVLANLATIPEGRNIIGQENGIPVLVEVVELGSHRGKENAAAALLQLCTTSSRFCNQVLQEGAVPPLVALSQSGTPRAKEKAQSLLSYFRNQRHGNGGRP
ncbi:hypothetical protein ACFE04_022360 [Oxalis oulophora]